MLFTDKLLNSICIGVDISHPTILPPFLLGAKLRHFEVFLHLVFTYLLG